MTEDDKSGQEFIKNLKRAHQVPPDTAQAQPGAEPGNPRFSFEKLNQEHQRMAADNENDAARAKQAQHIKSLEDSFDAAWPIISGLIRRQSRTAKARYDALIREGFEPGQALHLCVRAVEM